MNTAGHTNQYRTRRRLLSVIPKINGTPAVRCGQIWGTDCPHPVRPPDWAHGRHPSSIEQFVTAGNSDCPAEMLSLLARSRSVETRQRVAGNPNTPAATLETLSRDRAADDDRLRVVRWAVAGNPNTPPATLDRLSEEGRTVLASVSMRTAVAGNPACPPELLERLFWSRPDLRSMHMAIAGNPGTPPEMLIRLLEDTDPEVLREVTSNPGLPRSVLAMWQLAHDDR